MKRIALLSRFLAYSAAALIAAPTAAQIHPHHEAQIRKAVPAKPRVAPRKPRTVLIWNTPPAFMDKDVAMASPEAVPSFHAPGRFSGRISAGAMAAGGPVRID